MEQRDMAAVDRVLEDLMRAAVGALGEDLVAVVLFGSAAEGRLRPGSDVNLLFLLERFDPTRIDVLRAPLRVAHAAENVEAMFLLRDEFALASELFAVKFNDIAGRHRVLYGDDPFEGFTVDRAALARRLREVLLNLAIRLRERYARISLREEQLVREIADAAGPLRAAAVALLHLAGESAESPRAALERVAAQSGDQGFAAAVATLPLARQEQALPTGVAGPTLIALSRLASFLGDQLERGQ